MGMAEAHGKSGDAGSEQALSQDEARAILSEHGIDSTGTLLQIKSRLDSHPILRHQTARILEPLLRTDG